MGLIPVASATVRGKLRERDHGLMAAERPFGPCFTLPVWVEAQAGQS